MLFGEEVVMPSVEVEKRFQDVAVSPARVEVVKEEEFVKVSCPDEVEKVNPDPTTILYGA